MKPEDVKRIKQILDESLEWEPEVLERMPKLFLLIRENYLQILDSCDCQKCAVQSTAVCDEAQTE